MPTVDSQSRYRKGAKPARNRVPEKRGLFPTAVRESWKPVPRPLSGTAQQPRTAPRSRTEPAAVPRPGRAPAATHRLTTPVLILICLRRGSAMAAGAVTAQPRAAHAPQRQPGRHHRSGREPRAPPAPRRSEHGPAAGKRRPGRGREGRFADGERGASSVPRQELLRAVP